MGSYMSRKRSNTPQSRAKSRAAQRADRKRKEGNAPRAKPSEEPAHQPFLSAAGMREIVESVVIAFVLAFLFRTFEAEAFVIPTGSMAPTLMGRHKDVVCPECHNRFQISASDEIDSTTGKLTGERVTGGTCPMCRHTMDFRPGNPEEKIYPSYKGDRILVSKFAYRLSDPERWDVAVFKYPGGAQTNFIKRLVGRPNETICISHGDLFVKPVEADDFSRYDTPSYQYDDFRIDLDKFAIARKPAHKIRAMLQPVYDNDHTERRLIEAGWPVRWAPVQGTDQAAGWEPSADNGSFHTDGSVSGDAWIAYRHFVPSYQDWQALEETGALPTGRDPQPQLITDFSAYNTDTGYGVDPEPRPDMLGLHWVGDLAVECMLEVQSPGGEALFELVEGGEVFCCRIDVATGKAALSIEGLPDFHPIATTRVRGPGKYRIMFANVDDQLLLWVNDRVVSFDGESSYPLFGNTRPRSEDRHRPVRIGSRGAALRVSHLKIHRDVYYIAQRTGSKGPITDFVHFPHPLETEEDVAGVLSDTREWAFFRSAHQIIFPLGDEEFLLVTRVYRRYGDSLLWNRDELAHYISRELVSGAPIDNLIHYDYELRTRQDVARIISDPQEWQFFRAARQVAFPLSEDQFLVLGDNSAESKDSRLWSGDLDSGEAMPYYVRRDLLMGKALFIYWPHSLDKIPTTDIPVRFFPNFWRMHFVR